MAADRSVVLGFWQDRPPEEALATAEAADRLGFGEVWVGEMATYDAFALATAIGVRVRASLTVGPLAVHVRTPVGMAMGVASVASLTGRAVRLAIGTSSDVVVGGWHGRERLAPAATLATAATALRPLLAGERGPGGYRLRLPAPDPGGGPQLTIAAFGPRAVQVAGRHADRVVLNMVTPAAVARYRAALDRAAAEAGRSAPRLAVWLAAAVDPEPEAIAQLARGYVGYLAAPGYGEVFAEAGFADLVALARSGAAPRDVLAEVPSALLAEVGLVGSVAAVEARLGEYEQAGADEVGVVPATAGDPAGERTLAALAPPAA